MVSTLIHKRIYKYYNTCIIYLKAEHGTYGRKLDISSTDKGIKIPATKIVADDSAWQSIDGRWELDIPVADMDIKQMKSRSYDIDYIIGLGGCAIKFKKFISAPSGSYLVYDFEKGDSFAGISIQSMSLQSAGKRLDMLMNYMGRMYGQESASVSGEDHIHN